jgi:hypothetical protein
MVSEKLSSAAGKLQGALGTFLETVNSGYNKK